VSEEIKAIHEFWFNLPDYSLKQAINLASGAEPDSDFKYLSSLGKAIHQLIVGGINSNTLHVKLVHHPNLSDYAEIPKGHNSRTISSGRLPDHIDFNKTRVSREDLISVLRSHGLSFPPQGSGLLDENLREEIKKLNSELTELKRELTQLKNEAYIPRGKKLKLALDIEREQWVPWLDGKVKKKPTELSLYRDYAARFSGYNETTKRNIYRVSKLDSEQSEE
jgi:hypothetical protein